MATTTSNSPFAWRPDVTALPAAEIVPDALVLQTSTVAGSVEGDVPSVRCPFVAEDPSAGFVDEGAPIDLADPNLDEVVVTTRKVATLAQFSRETLAQPNAVQLITSSISRSVVNAANRAYLHNNSSPTGLVNRSGVESAGAITTDLDVLVDALTAIEVAGGQATHLICHPSAWGYLQTLKQGTALNAPLIGSGVQEAVSRTLLGVPVLTTAAMPYGGVLALDRSAIISAVGQVMVARSDDAAFGSDAAQIRATLRFGFDLLDAKRVVSLTAGDTEPDESSSSSSSSSSS